MKLAIDCRFLGKSGIGTYLGNVLDELMRREGHRLLLVCGDVLPDVGACRCEGEIFKTDIKPFSPKEMLRFPTKAINECDVFLTPYINVPGGIRIPVYSTIHDVIFLDLPYLTSTLGRLARRWYIHRAIRLSAKVFTVSDFSRERILHHFKTKKEIEVIYNVVSRQIRDYRATATPAKDYFLFVGNIKRHKGLATLLDAYGRAKRKGLKERLVIVGNADKFRTADETFSTLLKNAEGVEFTGYVSDEKLCLLICNAKALVQPSFYEGFGLPPIEAMYLGTRAIVSDIPVFKEIYSDLPVTFFKCGDSDDLSAKLLENAASPNKEVTRRRISEKFDITKEVDKILETIKS